MVTFSQSDEFPNTTHVVVGKRCIGFIMPFTIGGERAWRFLCNKKDWLPRFPDPAPKHATREDAIQYVLGRMP